MENKILTTKDMIELEQVTKNDLFLSDNNRNINSLNEIINYYKNQDYTLEEAKYLILSVLMPFEKFKEDIEKLENREYSLNSFISLMIKKYLKTPKSINELNIYTKLVFYRYCTGLEIRNYINKNNQRGKKYEKKI